MRCLSCGSKRVWKDGLRHVSGGKVQRFLCRSCGHRFSETDVKVNVAGKVIKQPDSGKNFSKADILFGDSSFEPSLNDLSFKRRENIRSHSPSNVTVTEKRLNIFRDCNRDCRVCASDGEAKNLVEVESRTENQAAGATKLAEADITEKTLPFTMWMKKQGYRESTITTRTRIIKSLLRKGANLYDPESIKEVVAKQKTWNENTKFNVVNTYSCFLLMCGGTWTPPRYKETRQLPFIPTELEIDQLIAGCGKKTAAFLQLLKETAIRAGEAQNLEWKDIDTVRYIINVKPEKNSAPRIFKVTTKLIGMLMALPRKGKKVFGNSTVRSRRATFCDTRKRVAQKLQNPRILQIHFHTFRHWKATTLYHKTKDLAYVKNFLGHKNVNNTMLYIQLATTIFKDISDQYVSRVAVNAKGARALIEVGFEKVDEFDGKHIYRKRIDPTP